MEIPSKLKSRKLLITVFLLLVVILLGAYIYKNNTANRQYDMFKSLRYPSYVTVKYSKDAHYILDCFDNCSTTSVNLIFNGSNATAIVDLTKVFEDQGFKLEKEDSYCFPSSPGEECMYVYSTPKATPLCTHINASYKTFNEGKIVLICGY